MTTPGGHCTPPKPAAPAGGAMRTRDGPVNQENDSIVHSVYQLDITCIIMNVIEYSAVARTSVTCGSVSPS